MSETSETTHDLAVVGLGIVGALTTWLASRAGLSVVGLDRGKLGHQDGASHGGTRIFRRLSWESPAHSAFADRSMSVYRALEAESRMQVFRPSHVLAIGRPDSDLVARARMNADLAGISYETFRDAEDAGITQFRLEEGEVILREQDGGILRPEQAVKASLEAARRSGAKLHFDSMVRDIRRSEAGWRLTTPANVLARRVIVATGAWLGAGQLIHNTEVEPRRVVQAWFSGDALCELPQAFAHQTGQGRYWGIADDLTQTMKLGGSSVPWLEACERNRPTPVSIDELKPLQGYVENRMPNLSSHPVLTVPCLDGYRSDSRFLVEEVRDAPGVLAAGGLSGHGFKHAAALADLLANWAQGKAIPPEPSIIRPSYRTILPTS